MAHGKLNCLGYSAFLILSYYNSIHYYLNSVFKLLIKRNMIFL